MAGQELQLRDRRQVAGRRHGHLQNGAIATERDGVVTANLMDVEQVPDGGIRLEQRHELRLGHGSPREKTEGIPI
jgi:hypothetical protein